VANRRRSARWGVGAVLVAIALLGACTTTATSSFSHGRLRVVAAESPWGAVARAVGGDDVEVVSVIKDANVDPHEYTPTAWAAAQVALAAVVIDNGLGYDDFITQLLSTGAAHQRRTVTAADVLGISGPDANPHLWYMVERVPKVARAMADAFSAADPAHRADYRANLVAFDASLAPLDATLSAIRSERPGAPVAQTERVAGYLLAEAGLDVVSPAGFATSIEQGHEPNAADTQAMGTLLRGGGVEVLINNIQTTSAVTTAAVNDARSAGVPVVGFSEIVEPSSASYVVWQQRQLDALARALGVAVGP